MRVDIRQIGRSWASGSFALALIASASIVALGSAAQAAILDDEDIVNAAANIYQVGGSTEAYAPNIVNVSGITSIMVSVPSTFNINGGSNPNVITLNGNTSNDADGVGAATSSSSNTGYGGIAGLSAPNAGYLTGVFIGSTVSPTAPAALSFTTTNFTSLSPLLQQAFFIGDGLTGDGTGQAQIFYVPTGATELVLGISDACGYNGAPGCYGDNFGSFKDVTVSGTLAGVSPVPLPASAPMFGAALLALGAVGYGLKRKKAAAA